jgi:organic radical activating enzyme
MSKAQQNFTIVVNWKLKGFGCAKVCSYCNWRDSKFLPHGGQSAEAISAFITQCKKSFVTISGGADPLYKFEEYGDQLLAMIKTIKEHGFKVRIITREVQHIAKLRGMVDYFSISLDADVMEEIKAHQSGWTDLDIEYSLVLPPIPTADIVRLKPQYAALRSILGKRLVLRENLNSIFPLDFKLLSFGHSGIVYVPKSLCLSGRYLATIDSTGSDLVQDNEGLATFLMGNPNVYLFGSMVKHLVNPKVHMEYADIDVIALSSDVLESLQAQFSYTFKATSPSDSYPRYYIGKSTRAGKTIQLLMMHSASDALQFLRSAQYDVDRIGYSNHRFFFDPKIGEAATRNAIDTKRVKLIKGPRSMDLFHITRPRTEQIHRIKLLDRGFAIAE